MAKLPLKTKLLYGLGGLGINLCDMVLLQWLVMRYSPDEDRGTVLLGATVFGAIFMLGRVGDGIYNLVVGHWSDNYRSPKGRRIPFVSRGLIPLAIVFFLLFNPGDSWSTNVIFVWALVLIQAHFFFYAVVVTPYLCLLPELTSDLGERVTMQTLQTLGIVVSLFIFGSMGAILQFGWGAVAGTVSVVTILALSPVALFIKEDPKPPAPEDEKPNIFRAIGLTFKNPAFRYIAASTAFFWFSLSQILALLPYWVTEVLGLKESAVVGVMIPYLVATVISAIVLFNFLTKVLGKHVMMLFTFLGSAACFGLLAAAGMYPFGSPYVQTIVVCTLMGFPVAGFMVLPFALLADAVDYDEQLTGQRREAIFFGLQGVVQKLLLGAGALTFTAVAFDGKNVTEHGLRTVCLAAMCGGILAFVIFLFYPLRERDGKVVHKNAA